MLRRAVIITLTVGLALGAGAGLVFSQGGPAKVAMLLPGSINDQSWNAAGYAGLTKLKAMGIEIAYSENVQAADHIEAVNLVSLTGAANHNLAAQMSSRAMNRYIGLNLCISR